jgi:hypothetical protein
MADVKISGLPASTTPLDGTEVLPVVQGSTTKKVSVANLTAGRSVSAGSVTNAGNLAFTGTGNRITGDLNQANHADRLLVQTSVSNANSIFGIIPNGTGTNSQINLYNSSTAGNCSAGQFLVNGSTDVRFISTGIGSGTTLPMTFFTSSSERMRIATNGDIAIGNNNPGVRLHVSSSTDVQLRLAENTNTYYVDIGRSSVDGMIQFNANQGSGYKWLNNGSEAMRIHSSKGVSIGNTTDPGAGNLSVTGTVRTEGYTVATLPAAGVAGRRAYVTDATLPTYLGALTGGGAVVCPVFDNGTAWVSA